LVLASWVRLRIRRARALSALRASAIALPAGESSPATEARVRWAVNVVGRRIPLARNCLVRAMVARSLLRRRGYTSRVVVGVARASEGRLTAHAWVENPTGELVVGGHEAGSYTPLACKDLESA